jgi:Tol biopolymer transport system component
MLSMDISPDGKRIVFDSNREGKIYIWTMSVEGGEMQRVTMIDTWESCPKWSPDGREIAYCAAGMDGNSDIWVVPFEGGHSRQVTSYKGQDFWPAWSPSGKEIVYLSIKEETWEIWTIPVEGGEARRITTDEGVDHFPKWSPDGKWLLFRSRSRLWRVPPMGGSPEPVTERGAINGVWSPDGKKIYFIAWGRKEGDNIWEVPAEGGEERLLTNLSAKVVRICDGLATDGKSLFFVSQETAADLWVADVVWE